MYIDNSGADGHELKIEVDGHEYTEEATESLHHDGTMDTADVDGDDGGHTAYTDTDHDGTADLATRYDAEGHVVGESHYDAATGQWNQSAGSASSGMTVDTAQGEQNVGPATADTDGDGTNDTAVVTDAEGNTFLYTDTNGDGKADYAMEIAANGQVTISEHTGDHQWTQIEHGHLDGSGNYQKDSDASSLLQFGADDQSWGGAEQANGEGLVRTDPATGEWT
ncbi:hypothetical protein [Kutzneria sp. CA-103260]|uniref:hypothetical protein n=1 Tax=Kutzneria sp. CA-103260 TaxID=2802641 RepID=UPI001BAA46C3|nr:hypothetical protein [Kutzneria sp. CA-103260]QUQ70105.1 hypothetical protein JJ691_78760 [Kutzneria sp. CA-103260]